ncbi:MAG: cytochrome c3 family protein [Deltaproteobacteria bacterium]|nr:cytochrome c3 family protein [Deltaproteobacteria bacterium]
MKTTLFFTIMSAVFLITSVAVCDQDKGAATIMLQGGSSGNVSFSHHRHQNALGNCNLCHSLFPQNAGSTEKLKAQGKLKNKEVMEQCRTCHRQRADRGGKTGPTGCKGCHQK